MADKVDTLAFVRAGAKLRNDEAARFLGYEPLTIKNSRHTGKLAGVISPPHLKQGRTVLYDLADLIEWQEQFEIRTCTRDVGVA